MTIRPHQHQEILVCSICLENIEHLQATLDHKVTVASKEIFHTFHEECLRGFLETPVGKFCPICRADASVFGEEFQRHSEEQIPEDVFFDTMDGFMDAVTVQMRQVSLSPDFLPSRARNFYLGLTAALSVVIVFGMYDLFSQLSES